MPQSFRISRGQFLLSPFAIWAADKQPHVVFVAGDHEYSGEVTMPLLAAALEKRYGIKTTCLRSAPDHNGETDIPGLEALETADMVVFYLRWRQLVPEQVSRIESYLNQGKPVIGLRTSSHAFHYPAGHALEKWNRWGPEVFGTPPGWNVEGHTHYGHQSTTHVTVNAANAKDPILAGVSAAFDAPSWLYHVLPKYPPPEARILLYGDAVSPNKPAVRNPVAWTWTNTYGARSFYTSLGHPGDFGLEPFQRMLTQAIFWAMDRKPNRRWEGRMAIDIPYRGFTTSK